MELLLEPRSALKWIDLICQISMENYKEIPAYMYPMFAQGTDKRVTNTVWGNVSTFSLTSTNNVESAFWSR